MFRIKICGITRREDATAAAAAGADAVGLNFYPPSVRYLPPEAAREVTADLPLSVWRVGVFVNATAAEIVRTAALAGLTAIQLHGDEPPEFGASLAALLPAPLPILRAFRLKDAASLADVGAYLAAGRVPEAVLVDAHQPGSYGGTGHKVDWEMLAAFRPSPPWPSLVLAGGLTPANVAAAIRLVRPAAVDVAGGVESAPGRKDAAAVSAFVSAAAAAFAERL